MWCGEQIAHRSRRPWTVPTLNSRPWTVTPPVDGNSAIDPTSITNSFPTLNALTETVAAGDLVMWAADCASATPSADLTDGDKAATAGTGNSKGTYQLCYRARDGSDSVKQTGITLNEQAGTSGIGACLLVSTGCLLVSTG